MAVSVTVKNEGFSKKDRVTWLNFCLEGILFVYMSA